MQTTIYDRLLSLQSVITVSFYRIEEIFGIAGEEMHVNFLETSA